MDEDQERKEEKKERNNSPLLELSASRQFDQYLVLSDSKVMNT